MASSTAHVLRLDPDPATGGWWLAFAAGDPDEFYEVVDAIKALPRWARRFDAQRKVWWVADESYLRQLVWLLPDLAAAIAAAKGGRGAGFRGSGPPSHGDPGMAGGRVYVPTEVARAFSELHLLPSAPSS